MFLHKEETDAGTNPEEGPANESRIPRWTWNARRIVASLGSKPNIAQNAITQLDAAMPQNMRFGNVSIVVRMTAINVNTSKMVARIPNAYPAFIAESLR
jgi:hypothetical protein